MLARLKIMRRSIATNLGSLVMLSAMTSVFACGCTLSEMFVPEPTPGYFIINPSWEAAEFTLLSGPGETVSMSDFRGDIVIMTSGFTHCPDVCPTTLAIWKKVHRLLGEDAGRVHFLFVSVDPERDTPELMQAFVGQFNDGFYGLTGTLEEIEDFATDYRISFRKVPYSEIYGDGDDVEYGEDDYFVNHSALTYLIDAEGQVVLVIPYNTTAEDIVKGIVEILDV